MHRGIQGLVWVAIIWHRPATNIFWSRRCHLMSVAPCFAEARERKRDWDSERLLMWQGIDPGIIYIPVVQGSLN
jgi:hypothetical protein